MSDPKAMQEWIRARRENEENLRTLRDWPADRPHGPGAYGQMVIDDAGKAMIEGRIAAYHEKYGHIEAFLRADTNQDGIFDPHEEALHRSIEQQIARQTGDDPKLTTERIDSEIAEIKRGAEEWDKMLRSAATASPPEAPRASEVDHGRGGGRGG